MCRNLQCYVNIPIAERTAELLINGGCSNYAAIKLTAYSSRHTIEECTTRCNKEIGCEGFGLHVSRGMCLLEKAGCITDATNPNFKTYKMTSSVQGELVVISPQFYP